jgi:hypothetical protein
MVVYRHDEEAYIDLSKRMKKGTRRTVFGWDDVVVDQ